ncbi:MAG: DUF1552 domain-containing protein [Myxococcota bacterium]
MPIRSRISRRAFLGGAATTAALAPFVPVLESQAGASGYPTRLIVLYTPAGSIMPRWRPTGTEKNWELSQLLTPLAPHKEDIIVIDGVDNEAAHHGVAQPGQGGHRALASLWSGVPEIGTSEANLWSGGVTLDQHVAQRVGGETLFPSLEFGADIRDENTALHRLSYTGAAEPIEPVADPQVMLERIFGDPDASQSDILRIRDGRLSVIDSVAGSLDALTARTSQGDKAKIEQHLTALRDVEKQVQAGLAACEPPALDPLPQGGQAFDNYPMVTSQNLDLMVAALACDATRVASFMWSWENSSVRFPWLNLAGAERRFHPLSHLGDSPDFALQLDWYAGQVSALLDRLAAVPEGDGTLLDHSVVVWASPCSVSYKHISRNLPIVLAGGGNGYFETGRYHRFGNYDFASESHDPHGGRTMNDLCLSLMHAMGITDEETFGSPEFCTEPLL